MLLQFINPKGILYGLTVVATFILPFQSSTISITLFSIFLGFIGFLSTFVGECSGLFFRNFFQNIKNQFNIVMALLLLYVAISIFI